MKHLMLPRFWSHYQRLPKEVREAADKSYEPRPIRTIRRYTSRRLDKGRVCGQCALASTTALGLEKPEGIVWFWIGTHAEYDRLVR